MSHSPTDILHIDRHTTHWLLTLNRPENRNALSSDLVEALLISVQSAHAQQVPLLVLQGAGSNFSAGFDFTDFEQQSEGDLLLRFVRIEQLLQAVAYGPSTTLVLAHGTNFGAGVDLIAACRHRVATPASRFRMPGLQFGLALGTRRLAQRIGEAHAYRVLETSLLFDGAEALAMGLVQTLADTTQWPQQLETAINAATQLPPESRQYLRERTQISHADPDGDLAALVRSAATPGLKDRIRAYRTAGAAGAATGRPSALT